jgi:hypothetical protein
MFPRAWELAAEPNTELLKECLRWIVEDSDRFASAAAAMRWLPPGFHMFPIGVYIDPQTGTTRTVQFNFYHEDYPGNQGPHAHAKKARTTWYALPNTWQLISRYQLLPPGTPRLPDVPVLERYMIANNLIDPRDGTRPVYRGTKLGRRLVADLSMSQVVALGGQQFGSREIHNIAFRGKGTAVSVHRKDEEESPSLSSFTGLIYYKGATPEGAEAIVADRQMLAAQYEGSNMRLGPATMIFLEEGQELEEEPRGATPEVAESLILGGLATAEFLDRH